MLNIAIIGVGNISRLHLEAYLTFPERCEIVALVDILPERAQQAKERLGLTNAAVYSSHTDMLVQGGIDLVSICTPPYCHADIAVDCLKAGCHVLVEKPMAASLAECDRMLAAEKESGRQLSVVAQNRFRDELQSLKAVLDSGKAGRILHAQVDSYWWRGHNYYDLWWRGRWDKEGGGCTLNHAVHHIDMLLWMMGVPTEVTAVLSNAGHDNAEVEDLSIAVLRYPQGALAQITSSVVHHGSEQQLVFQGEYARVSAPWKVCASTEQPNGFPIPNEALETELHELAARTQPLTYQSHKAQAEDMLSVAETGRSPSVPSRDGRSAIELITAIYQAGSTQCPVKLPLTPDSAFYTVEGILGNTPRFYKKSTFLDSFGNELSSGSDYKMKL